MITERTTYDFLLFIPTGGYYLTTLYASLYYISSFQPRLAARQLSIEAQESLNRWHRRRTLYCNQSRRSTHRRTIRKQSSQTSRTRAGHQGERGAKPSEQEGLSEKNFCAQTFEGKNGFKDEDVALISEREPGGTEDLLSQSSEKESAVKEEDCTEMGEGEPLSKEESAERSSETQMGCDVKGVRNSQADTERS